MKGKDWVTSNLPLLLVGLIAILLVIVIQSFRLPKPERHVTVGCLLIGSKEDGGWMRSLGNQGMYNGAASEANFRKTASARKIIDADGGTYAPDYKKHAGAKKAAKSRYIMAIGQDGHVR